MDKYRKEIDQETFERIESYLTGRMDEASRRFFEAEMEKEVLLRNEVALQRKLMAAVEINTFMAGRFKKKAFGWWYAAAAALLLAGAAIWFFNKPAANSTEQLYAAYFQPDPGLPVVMGSSDSLAYSFYDGMISYKEEHYTDAFNKWTTLAEQAGYTDTLRYYMGMAQLNSGNTSAAVQQLQPLSEKATSGFQQQASWYLAICYLKQGKKDKAIPLLAHLENNEQAQQLLIRLKE